MIKIIPNKRIIGITDLIATIEEWGMSKGEKFLITTPYGRRTLANHNLIYFKNKTTFLKDYEISVIVLLGPIDEKLGTFILCLGSENLGYRRNIQKSECKLRTFDPTDQSIHLFDIDPCENFEVEYNHIVKYEFYVPYLDKALFIELNND